MKYPFYIAMILTLLILSSCEDIIEVDVPNDRITSASVFDNDNTAESAVRGIYNQLFNTPFSSGFQNSVTVLSGLSADNLQSLVSDSNLLQFQENELIPDNSYVQGIWSGAYNIIYMTNAALEGLANGQVSLKLRNQLEGEALFLRAFTYFYLVNLYGDVPLVLSTDYQVNASIQRTESEAVYNQIITDLENAVGLLGDEYENSERVRANSYVARALLARVYIHIGNWNLAEEQSSQVINSGLFDLLPLNEVFKANSREAIWQISPIYGGSLNANTNEGALFIMENSRGNIALTEDLLSKFDTIDLRLENWIGKYDSEEQTYYFPFKYKVKNSTTDFSEYSMVMRLAEQFLIRAEARAHLGDLAGSIEDLNKIRTRSGLDPLSRIDPELNQDKLRKLIMEEYRKELFAEWGHRWLSLKRNNTATAVLSNLKPQWDETDTYYPIPQQEINKNPKLVQNPGY